MLIKQFFTVHLRGSIFSFGLGVLAESLLRRERVKWGSANREKQTPLFIYIIDMSPAASAWLTILRLWKGLCKNVDQHHRLWWIGWKYLKNTVFTYFLFGFDHLRCPDRCLVTVDDNKLITVTEGMQLRISYDHNFVQVKLCPSVYIHWSPILISRRPKRKHKIIPYSFRLTHSLLFKATKMF